MALDDYFSDPSQDCLARLFDAVNAMDLSAAPTLTRNEKIVMRCSERKDIFSEKFVQLRGQEPSSSSMLSASKSHHQNSSTGSISSFEEGILMRQRERTSDSNKEAKPWEPLTVPQKGRERPTAESTASQSHSPRSDSSFSLIGSTAWAGDENGQDGAGTSFGGPRTASALSHTLVTNRARSSTDVSSSSSNHGKDNRASSSPMAGLAKDTHFYHTTIAYKGHQLPIKMPLSTFPEEVGEVSPPNL